MEGDKERNIYRGLSHSRPCAGLITCIVQSARSPNPTEAALVHSLAVKKLLRFVKCFHRTIGYCAEHLSTLSCPIPLCSSVMISSLTDEKPEMQRINLPKISYFVHGQAGFKSLNLHATPAFVMYHLRSPPLSSPVGGREGGECRFPGAASATPTQNPCCCWERHLSLALCRRCQFSAAS